MAWTAPRTWVTAEVVTAALMNTHVRDNLLVTAPAVLTTTGDVLYASAANAPARLAIGTVAGSPLVAGASIPEYTTDLVLGTASDNGSLAIHRSIGHLALHENDAADAADHWIVEADTDQLRVRWRDDSLSTDHPAMDLDIDDFILHTGAKGAGEGAVIIATDTNSSGALTTSGGIILNSGALATGGPAYIKGFWMVRLLRTSAASLSSVTLRAREDGNNLDTAMAFSTPNRVDQGDVMPLINDEHVFTGMFWRRVTSADSSAYEIFAVAGDNSRFSFVRGHLYVESIQYPT